MNCSLSFCITCKNRIHQIKQTLKKNLDDNISYKDIIEFVLVDFGSTDGLKEWILSNFQQELLSGYLRYLYTDELPFWHASIAKNTAHAHARNNILVNLDCDNYTGEMGGYLVIQTFVKHNFNIVFHQFSGTFGDGSFGRISMLKNHFHEAGGYDEALEPMAYEDNDLILRLRKLNLTYIGNPDPNYNLAIKNDRSESIRYTKGTHSWREMLRMNEIKSKTNISRGKIIANDRNYGIRENIVDVNASLTS
jgi:glycosyltransferase involved in cell wall biosynthesis